MMRERQIDWVFAGLNGDRKNDQFYRDVIPEIFPGGVNVAAYKHLCGEYLTSTGFALWAAANAIRNQSVPEVFQVSRLKNPKEIRNILIFNHSKGNRYSIILLTRPE